MPDRAASRARWAAAGLFFLIGCVISTWFTRIPQFQTDLGLTAAELAWALLTPSIGAVLAMQVAGRAINRFGGVPVARVSTVAAPLLLLVPAAANSLAVAIVGLAAFGVADGLADVAANTQGIAVERALGRPVLSGLHAAWGVGAMVGAVAGSAAIAAQLSVSQHFAIMAGAMMVLGAVCGTQLLPTGRRAAGSAAPGSLRWHSGWTRHVVAVGVLGAATMLCEGAISNWSAIYLREELAATATLASIGYVVFTVAETGTRLVGDALRRRIAPRQLVLLSVATAMSGLGVVLSTPAVWLAVAGFGVLGVGLAVLSPIAFAAVGHSRSGGAAAVDPTGAQIASYTTLSYGGVLAGPAVIGWLAGPLGLSAALALLYVPLAVVAALSLTTTLSHAAAVPRW